MLDRKGRSAISASLNPLRGRSAQSATSPWLVIWQRVRHGPSQGKRRSELPVSVIKFDRNHLVEEMCDRLLDTLPHATAAAGALGAHPRCCGARGGGAGASGALSIECGAAVRWRRALLGAPRSCSGVDLRRAAQPHLGERGVFVLRAWVDVCNHQPHGVADADRQGKGLLTQLVLQAQGGLLLLPNEQIH